MDLVLEFGDAEPGHLVEVSVVLEHPGARVGELIAEFTTAFASALPVVLVDPHASDDGGQLGLWVGRRWYGPGELLVGLGLREGDTVRIGPADRPADAQLPRSGCGGCQAVPVQQASVPAVPVQQASVQEVPVLAVTEGPAAGATVALGPGPVVLGRAPHAPDPAPPDPTSPEGHPAHTAALALADATVSARHAVLIPDPAGGPGWWVRDLDSRNGTWIDDRPVTGEGRELAPDAVLRLGATHLRLQHPGTVGSLEHAGHDPSTRLVSATGPASLAPSGSRVARHRPPRPPAPSAPEPVVLPAAPQPTPPPRALSLVTVLTPLVMAGTLVIWTGNPRFGLFLVLGPILAVGTWWSGRRRQQRSTRRGERRLVEDLAVLAHQLDVLVDAEVARRRRVVPDLAEVAGRIRADSVRLWERRPGDDDWLRLRVGLGRVGWEPRVEAGEQRPGPPTTTADDVPGATDDPDAFTARARVRIDAEVARAATLPRCPVAVDLAGGGVVGIVGGSAELRRALSSALIVQAAAHHGPADLAIAVLTDTGVDGPWDWVTWLPHTRVGGGPDRWIAGNAAEAEQLPQTWGEHAVTSPDRTLLTVIEPAGLAHGSRGAALRALLQGRLGPVAGIVLAEVADELPAVTRTVVRLDGRSGAGCLEPTGRGVDGRGGGRVDELVVAGLAAATSRELARRLAPYEDPELEDPGAGLPEQVRLGSLLGPPGATPEAVLEAWAGQTVPPAPVAPVGIGAGGTVVLDLVRDGPHGLVVGTTGSGKSELLRSLVVGLAARVDPDHLTFVLVDYKGGSAFDRCAELPHTVGVLTDLDERLGERALRSLEAELRHREQVLRDAGAPDLAAYLRGGSPDGPLPRLVVVIDEFATLAADLPDLLGSLIGIAQRGRSLGVHLVLATQRPGGAISASITANTDLRIALRVQTPSDSVDVLGRPDAAAIPRSRPGRALLRAGSDEVVALQTAWVSAPRERHDGPRVRCTPRLADPDVLRAVHRGVRAAARGTERSATDEDDTDLAQLVAAIGEAARRRGTAPPRRPWLPPLPAEVSLLELLMDTMPAGPTTLAAAPVAVLGLGDEPDRQRRVVAHWDLAMGHLGVFGMVGSGTTSALRTVAEALARSYGPDRLHLHALDLGNGGLQPVAALPNAGTVVAPPDDELRRRLLRHLVDEVERRRGLAPQALTDEPWSVLLVDGIGALLAELDAGTGDAGLGDGLRRVLADGPSVRVVVALAGRRVGEVPLRVASLVARRLLLRHADPQELVGVGRRLGALPRFVPGRALDEQGREVQVAQPPECATVPAGVRRSGAAVARDGRTEGGRAPRRLRTLPGHITLAELTAPTVGVDGDPTALLLPVGLADADLAEVGLVLRGGRHVVVAGPRRSGVSTALGLVATQVRRAEPEAVIVGVCRGSSPLYGCESLDAAGELADLRTVLLAAPGDPRRWVVLVDEAARVADEGGLIAGLLAAPRPDLTVVAAARGEELRVGYGHWTRELRSSGIGILLRPDLGLDGEVLGVTLPRRVPSRLDRPGRGFVVNEGEARLAQLAVPDDPSSCPQIT